MKFLGALTTLLALSTALPAQGSETPPDYRKKIEKRVLEMRNKMREGKVREFNVYVHVRLTNNNKLKGVVKNGQFIEAQDGLDFVPAQRNQDKAGIRLWFSAGTNSFIFVPYNSIARYKIGRTLSDDQVKTIERGLIARRREEDRKRRELAAKKKAAKQVGGGADESKPADSTGAAAIPELTKEQAELLAEFPVKDGWSENKRNQLKLRRITVGAFPNKKEKRFEAVFDKWKAALDQQAKIDAAKLAAKRNAATKAAAKSRAKPTPAPTKSTPPAEPPKGGLPGPGK